MIFETDSEKLVRYLTKKEETPNVYVGNIVRGIQLRKAWFRHVSFMHIGRKGNKAAHKLAQHALIEPNIVWIEDTPPCIVTDVHLDKYNQ